MAWVTVLSLQHLRAQHDSHVHGNVDANRSAALSSYESIAQAVVYSKYDLIMIINV